ncbi:MAG TPA: histidine kinase, partial [Caldimonas sp.]
MESTSLERPAPASRMAGVLASVRHGLIAYARWLDSISWKRFSLLSVLAMIAAGMLSQLPPFSIEWGGSRRVETTTASKDAKPKSPVVIDAGKDGVKHRRRSYNIDIDKDGVHITPAAPAASAAAPPLAPTASGPGVHIKLPDNVDTEEVTRAIEEAQTEIEDRIAESRTRVVHEEGFTPGEHLPQFTFLLIVLSVVTKIMAAGRFKAEAKAVVATEIAESETLKRQVVEARMAAMQAQVEPHFLFNTLASIDHLIETDPRRASQMQKNLIALLRASMPAMREAHPTAHNLGREMAVIRPYLEILKVRMEDRLQIDVDVPEGLLSAEFPSMMIQSLVENAIKHGLEPKAEGGRL